MKIRTNQIREAWATALWTALFALLTALGVPAARAADSVLWVGNSRTYVGNLPEVYKALVKAVDKRDIRADMLVEGGGYLEGRVRSHALERELEKQQFDAVLLQERGHLMDCILDKSQQGSLVCRSSVAAYDRLARIANGRGAKVYVMGTHQPDDARTSGISRAEAITAARIKADAHVPIGLAYVKGLKARPGFKWMLPDTHPDRDLTLLMAVMSYYAIEKKWPAPAAITLDYRAFDNSVGFGDDTLGSVQNPDFKKTHDVVPAKHLADIIDIAKSAMSNAHVDLSTSSN